MVAAPLEWYLSLVIPSSIWSYIGGSVIVLFGTMLVLCGLEARNAKNKNLCEVPQTAKVNICFLSLLLAILWPLVLIIIPVGGGIALVLASIIFMTTSIVEWALKVMK